MVKMMKWRPWPPLISRKHEVKLTVHKLEGGDLVRGYAEKDNDGLSVEIRWKGSKISMGSFSRTVRRNFTREENVKRTDNGPNGGVVVKWDEEFHSVCYLSRYKDGIFLPWEINFTVLQRMNQDLKRNLSVVGSATLNIAEYSSRTEQQMIKVKIPSTVSGVAIECCSVLNVSLALLELRDTQEPIYLVQSTLMHTLSPPESVGTLSDKEEFSALKAGLRKVKIFSEYVSAKRDFHEDVVEARYSFRSEGPEYAFPFGSDSHGEFEEVESDETKQGSSSRKSFSYETLPCTNYIGVPGNPTSGITDKDKRLIYYSNRRRPEAVNFSGEELVSKVPGKSLLQNYTNILPWRKRKLIFRSPKTKSEPLLKKANGEEGGDDIDFERRQLSSDESLSYRKHQMDEESNSKQPSQFGDDSFAFGMWEGKEITSRDGQMKIKTQVFFASIDQRSEQAAGEGACTALVAVIADWLQSNHNLMPIKSQLDSLIRDGSMEWRKLCEKETYQERFPDKHFDLETVIEAKVCGLCVVPENSFVGFFHPHGAQGENFDFLDGAMSFDSIWEEISRAESSAGGEAHVFIIGWNDHFFVLKVEHDAYYIIDTLGERLHEGCNQAYILKFDKKTVIYSLQSSPEKKSQNVAEDSNEETSAAQTEESNENENEQEVVCQGKESCREYMKNFLAAIPIRELQSDIKKGRTMSTPLHHRLQIEFHYTQLQAVPIAPAVEVHSLGAADAIVSEVGLPLKTFTNKRFRCIYK